MTTTTNTTIADRILENLMSGDGCARKTRLGVDVSKLIARIGSKGARKTRLGVDAPAGTRPRAGRAQMLAD